MILSLLASVIAAGQTFACTPVSIWDGDGPLWCEEGPKIRLSNIAAREMDGSCKPGHPCPDASGEAAKAALVDLMGGLKGTRSTGHAIVDGPPLVCYRTGMSYGRVVASCTLPDGRDLGEAMLATGTVERWR